MATPLLHIQTAIGGFTVPLTHQPLTIGRSQDNLLHLDDPAVSPHHCVLLRIGDEVHVVDLRSSTGTLVNGLPVRFAPLSPGDVLRVGPAQVKVIGVGGMEAAEPAERGAPAGAPAEERSPTRAENAPADRSPPIKVVPDADLDRPPIVPVPRMLGELLLPRDLDAFVRSFLRRESGLMIICGPRGSGRTTTAYAMLRLLAANKRRIVTFEQPPELQVEGTEQVFVHNEREYAPAIERVLRDQPQVLMLGEPPTRAAANVASRAAMGRCLVIALSDSPDTCAVVGDWIEMGVQPKNLAASLGLVIGQRLVRRLCDRCKQPVEPNEEQARRLLPFAGHYEHIYIPDACSVCNNTGFVGQVGVFEVLQISDEVRGLMLARGTGADIRRGANPQCFVPLRLSAYARVAQGLTTIEEADRIVREA